MTYEIIGVVEEKEGVWSYLALQVFNDDDNTEETLGSGSVDTYEEARSALAELITDALRG